VDADDNFSSARPETDAGNLLWRDCAPGEHGVGRSAQMGTGGGDFAPRAAVVELTTVNQTPLLIEEKKLRGADSSVGLGDGLRFVEQVWEGEAPCPGQFRHLVRRVRGILDVGAVIAQESDEQRGGAHEVAETDAFAAGGIPKAKYRGGRSERGHLGLGGHARLLCHGDYKDFAPFRSSSPRNQRLYLGRILTECRLRAARPCGRIAARDWAATSSSAGSCTASRNLAGLSGLQLVAIQ
jgi:hypothetical protein